MQLPLVLSVAGLAAAAPLSNTHPTRGMRLTTPGFEVSGPGVGSNNIAPRQDIPADLAEFLKSQQDAEAAILRNIGARSSEHGDEQKRQEDAQMLQTLTNFLKSQYDTSMGVVANNGKRDDGDVESFHNRPETETAAHEVEKRQDNGQTYPQMYQTLSNVMRFWHDANITPNKRDAEKRQDNGQTYPQMYQTLSNVMRFWHDANITPNKRDVEKRQEDAQTLTALTNVLKNIHDTSMAIEANNGKRDAGEAE